MSSCEHQFLCLNLFFNWLIAFKNAYCCWMAEIITSAKTQKRFQQRCLRQKKTYYCLQFSNKSAFVVTKHKHKKSFSHRIDVYDITVKVFSYLPVHHIPVPHIYSGRTLVLEKENRLRELIARVWCSANKFQNYFSQDNIMAHGLRCMHYGKLFITRRAWCRANLWCPMAMLSNKTISTLMCECLIYMVCP